MPVFSSVMKFRNKDYEITLLDIPGHKDFSKDTYRVLTAVDCAVMIIDSAKALRARPIVSWRSAACGIPPSSPLLNKLDRKGMEPLDLFQNIDDELQIECVPLTWPIGKTEPASLTEYLNSYIRSIGHENTRATTNNDTSVEHFIIKGTGL